MGAVLCASTITRQDLAHAAGVLCGFLSNAMKHIWLQPNPSSAISKAQQACGSRTVFNDLVLNSLVIQMKTGEETWTTGTQPLPVCTGSLAE